MLGHDLRQALRALRRSPATAAMAVLTLGLGIGGNTAVFTWARALLLRPYPFAALDRLVVVYERHPQQSGVLNHLGRAAGDRNPVAPADFLDLRRDTRPSSAFERLAALRYREYYLAGGGEPERLRGIEATPELFAALGVGAALGRVFAAEEAQAGRDAVVVLTDGFWRRRFGADPGVVGREIVLNQRAHTIVGVLPAGIEYPPGGVGVWAPLVVTDALAAERRALSLRVVGRLRRSVTIAAAQDQVAALARGLEEVHPETNAGRSFVLVPLAEQQVGLAAPFLLVLHGAAACLLLVACANVAGLMLVRFAARQPEMAVRAALGAERWRIARLVLLETALLALLGGGLAVALAAAGANAIRASLPQDIAQWVAGWREIRVDAAALAFTLLLALLTAAVSGLPPVLQAAGGRRPTALLGGVRGGAARGGRGRLRGAVVAAQLVLGVVLAAGGALMVRGFGRLVDVYRGLDPERVLTFGMVLPDWRYREPQQIAGFYERVLGELTTIPGVDSAAVVSHLPADPGPIPGGVFAVEGHPAVESAEQPSADLQAASPAYFSTLRIPLRAGRLLGEADRAGAPGVVVVSESLARRYWPGEDPLGRRLRLGRSEAANANPWLTVVGVVGDVRQYWFDRQPRPTLYVPYLQAPRRGMSAVLRTGGDPESLIAAARGRVAEVDSTQPIEEVKSLARLVGEQMAFLRTAASLVSGLAFLSCLLAAVGVYGLLGHHVAQSVPELGVRVALGAGRRDILRLVLGRAAKLAAIGAALGLPGALAMGKLLAGSLYGVVGADPPLLAAITALLALVALLAAWVPARRAARVDPAATLRGG